MVQAELLHEQQSNQSERKKKRKKEGLSEIYIKDDFNHQDGKRNSSLAWSKKVHSHSNCTTSHQRSMSLPVWATWGSQEPFSC